MLKYKDLAKLKMKKKLIISFIALVAVVSVVLIALFSDLSSKIFQGALYNVRPIYSSCKMEGANFNSTSLDTCENFHKNLLNKKYPDGEYTIFANYTDRGLGENIIPISIKNGRLACTYLENNYQPTITVYDANNQIISQTLDKNSVYPLGSANKVVQINFKKNNLNYFYDTNICESSLVGELTNENEELLGTVKLDTNGFINSRPLIHEILINNNSAYYQKDDGQYVKSITPGNTFLTLNFAPDIKFKLTIPCSNYLPKVKIPNFETKEALTLTFKGIDENYFKNCGNKLYLNFQNANKSSESQIFNEVKWDYQDDTLSMYLDPIYLGTISDPETKFPVTYIIRLMLRDRSDEQKAYSLGNGVLKFTGFVQKAKPKVKNNDIIESNITQQSNQKKEDTDLDKDTENNDDDYQQNKENNQDNDKLNELIDYINSLSIEEQKDLLNEFENYTSEEEEELLTLNDINQNDFKNIKEALKNNIEDEDYSNEDHSSEISLKIPQKTNTIKVRKNPEPILVNPNIPSFQKPDNNFNIASI